MAELGNQIDGINKNKAKSEKDKAGMERDLQEARAGLEEAMRDHANMEKNCKMAQGLIVESNQKQDELARALNDADSTKKKLLVESQDLGRQIEETENAIGALQKNKISLGTQLEDTKKLADGEARDRAALLTKFKSLVTESENLRLKAPSTSSLPRLPKPRRTLSLSTQRLDQPRSLLPALPRSVARTLTRLLASGRRRRTTLWPSWMPPTLRLATTATRGSASSLLWMSPTSSWTLSAVKTRTSLTRSRTCSISLATVAAPSTSLTNRGGAWRARRRSSSLPWRRPRAPVKTRTSLTRS